MRLITEAGVDKFPVAALPDLLQRDDGLIWVDIPQPDREAGRVLADVFGFHQLAVKDSLERNRVPKAHGYADHVFFILHKPERGERGHVHYIELDQFVGRRYVVTVHGPVNPKVVPSVALRETSAVATRLDEGRLRPRTPFELSHAIVSSLTRHQEEFLEAVTADVWRLEQQVTSGQLGEPEEFIKELFRARHGLLAVRTMAALANAICVSIVSLQKLSDDGRSWMTEMAAEFAKVRSASPTGTRVPPRRHRLLPDRPRPTLVVGHPAAERGGPPAHGSQLHPKRGAQEDLRLGRHPVRANPRRHHLRYELRPHARTPLAMGLPTRTASYGRCIAALHQVFHRSGWL